MKIEKDKSLLYRHTHDSRNVIIHVLAQFDCVQCNVPGLLLDTLNIFLIRGSSNNLTPLLVGGDPFPIVFVFDLLMSRE